MRRKIWTAIILLFVILAGFFGFYLYRSHQAVDKVMKYQTQVKSELSQYGLTEDTQLVLAIIYTETKGGSVDVMQSSESLNGGTNNIDTNESITQGAKHLVDLLAYAQEQGCDVWTAVQAYNFGKAYIDYVAAHGGKNTTDLAKEYSRTVVAPSLGNTTEATYTHLTWDSFFYNGGRLYTNGGNFFYAQEVHFNFNLMKWLA